MKTELVSMVAGLVALVCLAGAMGMSEDLQDQSLGGASRDTVCVGVDIWECLDRTASRYRLWRYRDIRKWARAVAAADWDTNSPGGGPGACKASAETVKKARNGALTAFSSSHLYDIGMVDEYLSGPI